MKKKTWLALSLLVACIACNPTSTETVELTNASIELDAFSGLPNPTWQMTEAEARDIATRLRNLPAVEERLPEATLGYRGFTIRNADGQRIYVTRGLVATMAGNDATHVFRDAHDVEGALKAQARVRNYGGVVDRIGSR